MMNNQQIAKTFALMQASMSPQMAEIISTMVEQYMAARAGIMLEQQRAKIEGDAEVRASYQRKVIRATALLGAQGKFSLLKSQHKDTQPKAPDLPNVSALLAGLGKPQAPGAAGAQA